MSQLLLKLPFLDVQNHLLTGQTSYLGLVGQFLWDQKIICLSHCDSLRQIQEEAGWKTTAKTYCKSMRGLGSTCFVSLSSYCQFEYSCGKLYFQPSLGVHTEINNLMCNTQGLQTMTKILSESLNEFKSELSRE